MDEEKNEVNRPRLSSIPTRREDFATPVSMQGTDNVCAYCQLPCKNVTAKALHINKQDIVTAICTTYTANSEKRAFQF